MSCVLTQGINSQTCKDGTPGIIRAFITELANINTYTESAGVITAMTLDAGKQLWEYQQIKESASWTEEAIINVQAGSVGWSQTINLVIPKRDTNKRNEIKLLAQNSLLIICEDSNGLYWCLGLTRGADMDSGTKYDSGIKLGDKNGWDLVFKGSEHDPAPEISAAIVARMTHPAS